MNIAFWACLIFFISLSIKFRQKIIDRCRLIYYLFGITGPLAFPIIGNTWILKWKMSELTVQVLEWVVYYMNKKTDLVCFWVGPYPLVAAFSVDAVKAILESNVVITKGDEYKILERWLGKGLLISSGEKWKKHRKLLTPAFHFAMLHQFHGVHDRESQVFLEQIESLAGTNNVFDIYPFLKRFALDVICETSMGQKIDAQLNHYHPYVIAVRKLNQLSFAYSRMPWLWIEPIWKLSGYKAAYEKNLKLVTDFTRNIIETRREDFKFESNENGYEHKKCAFLDLLLSMEKEGDLTDADVRDEVETFMFEGHDTTASGMAWSLWCLAHHPDYQKRVIEEIDNVFGFSDRACTIEDLKSLPYLEMCIKESHRLFSPVPMFFRKVEQDLFECVGKRIPKGTTLLVAPILMHVSADHYDTPFSFNPEHFNKESVIQRNPFAYIPFSAGPRNCIGQKFALQEKKTLLSWFFRRFTIKPDIPFSAGPRNCIGQKFALQEKKTLLSWFFRRFTIKPDIPFFKNFPFPEIILKPSKGIPVKIERRSN